LHSWRQQDPTSALAWLATFRSLSPKTPRGESRTEKSHPESHDDDGCEAQTPRRYTSFENMGLFIIEVGRERSVRVIAMEDVSDDPDDL
jgi:hypothetical protein